MATAVRSVDGQAHNLSLGTNSNISELCIETGRIDSSAGPLLTHHYSIAFTNATFNDYFPNGLAVIAAGEQRAS